MERILFITMATFIFSSCQAPPIAPTDNSLSTLLVPYDSREVLPCTPVDPGPNWRGILIAAPQMIFQRSRSTTDNQSQTFVLSICGRYTLELKKLQESSGPMRFKLKHLETGAELLGEVRDQDAGQIAEPSQLEPSIQEHPLEDLAIGSCFKFSVPMTSQTEYTKRVSQFFSSSGFYQLTVFYGGLESNMINFTLE